MQENELKLSGFVNNQQKYIGNTEEGCLEKIYKLLDALDIKFDPNPNKIRQEDIYFDAAQRQIEKLGGSLRIRNFAGNGINIVARIGSQTDSNRVLISKECADFLLESERISSQNLSTVYSIKVKHDVVINVMNYYDKDNKIGRPKL